MTRGAIAGCEVFLVALPRRREHSWAGKTNAPIGRHALVKLTTHDGVVGWGEAPAIPTWGGAHMRQYGETPQTVRHIVLDHLAPSVVGASVLEIAVVHERMDRAVKGHPYAKAAIDIACHDAAGRALGIPTYALLGGRRREGLVLAHSLGLMPIEACVQEARQAVAEGARVIKCKTGLDPERDVEVVRAIRSSIGDELEIRVDANEGYRTTQEAVEVTRRQEEYRIMLCEQPVAGAAGLAEVARRIESPVMADESAWTTHDILELDGLRAAQCFSCYVTKPGGLLRARQQAELASALGMYCDIGGSIEMGIGNAANLHLGVALESAVLASVCPVTKPRGTPGPEVAGVYYLDDVVTESFAFEDGIVRCPEGPGLGVTVDEEKVRHYSGETT